MQGWQIFHAYDIRATAHPPTITQESERGGGRSFEDGLPDHVIREAATSEPQFHKKALRVSGECGERNTDTHLLRRVYFHVNRRIPCISAVRHFSSQLTALSLLPKTKNKGYSFKSEVVKALTYSQISDDNADEFLLSCIWFWQSIFLQLGCIWHVKNLRFSTVFYDCNSIERKIKCIIQG